MCFRQVSELRTISLYISVGNKKQHRNISFYISSHKLYYQSVNGFKYLYF